jgi:hypothetical protein
LATFIIGGKTNDIRLIVKPKQKVVWKVLYIYIYCANPTFLGVMGSFQDYLSILCPKQLGSYINLQAMEMMKCFICHTSSFPQVELMQNSQTTTKSQKGHVQYNINHGCTLMKNYLVNKHQNDFIEYEID